MKAIFLGILLWTCLISIAITQKQIDTFNILFPQVHTEKSSHPIELVTASGGCFQWASSSPQTVSVQGLQKGAQKCHNRGLVTLRHIGAYQGSIYVTATNIQTNQLSNIPVRISPVERIEIMAKSRLMNRNQMQDLKIFAYDKEHNMFTSLEGMKFEWSLIQGANVLSKVSLKNSHLSLPLDERKEIEKRGAESDILVVKGENPGKAVVRVKCIEPGYQHLRHQITVSVQERFQITPSVPTYMITSSTYNFGLISPSREVLNLTKPYYSATMSSKLFRVSNSLQVTAPLIEDQSILRVEDTRTVPAYGSQVVIYSKQPTSILLKVDEYLIVGEQAKVDVELYWNKQLLKGETRDYKIVTDLAYDSVKNTITGKQRTTATVKASYKTLSTERKVHIILPIKPLLPSQRITLPIDQTFQLKIIGGSGIYQYHIQNDIASISGSGVISSRKQGKAKITVSDKRVPRNRIVVELVVAAVDSLLPLETRKEVNVKQFALVFTMARGKNYQQYTKCSGQPISLEISHLASFEQTNNVSLSSALQFLQTKMSQSTTLKQTIMKNAILPLGIDDFISKFTPYIKSGDISTQQLRQYSLELQNYGICQVHNIRSSQKYDSTLVIYHRQNVNIKNKFSLRVYDKILNAIGKENGDYFIMTPLSALEWKTVGGSYPWQGKTRTLVNGVEYHTQYPIVKCPQRQTVLQMKLQRVNPQSSQLLLPASQSKTIYIHCKHPSQLKLKFEKQSLDVSTINGLKGQLIKGQLIPLDNKGESFYNASNLVYEVSKTAGGVKVHGDKFQFDALGANTAQVTFWTDKIQGQISTFAKVSTSFIYNSKQMFTVSPHPQNNHLTTLYNPKRPYLFTLQKISQNSQVQCQGSITCYYKNKQIHVNTTRLGSGSMRIVDKSLYQYPTLLIRFDVVDADRIVLEVERHNVEVGKKIVGEVKMFYKQELIPAWQYDTRSLLLVHEAGLRSKEIESSSAQNKNMYQITAQKPGSYKVTVEQHYPKYLQSSPVLLTVYPKFETSIPSLEHSYTKEDVLQLKGELTVAVDCIKTVHLKGGPQLVTVTHSIKDKGLLQVKQTPKQTKEISILGIKEGKTTVTFTITSADSNTKISIIHLTINIKPIDHVTIYSLDEALINAQFRIIPYLVVEGRVLMDSVCEFQYKWTSDSGKVKLLGVDGKNKRGLGVNATAVKEGDAFVTVQVLKNNKVLFATTKQITVHKSLDIQLPTVIGQHQSLTSTSSNLLIPPNSGYQLQDPTLSIHKLSQSSSNLLTINPNNRLLTGRQRGVVSVKLQKLSDQSYNNYLNIIVTDIKGLFIENSYSVVNVDIGRVSDVKFYVQDMYGRLFYNNLLNVEYDIVSSNQDVFTVSLDDSKNYIRIHPRKQGEATLMLKLKSGESNLNKLIEIPHDVVVVQVGKVIEPQSPIYLVVGGQVNIQYYGKGTQQWEVITGNKIVAIDQKNRIIRALQTGQSTISINNHIITVRILDLILKQRTISQPTPGSAHLITEYVSTGKWMDQTIYFQSISNTFNYINNNLNLTCLPVNRRYFTTNSSIIKTGDFDKLRCETVMNYQFEIYQSMPSEIQLKVVSYDKTGAKTYLYTAKKPILPTFWIPKVYKSVILSPDNYEVDIFVKSPHKLHTEVIGGKAEWIEERFDQGSTTHGVKIKIDPTQSHHNLNFKLIFTHPQTAQTQEINVKYIIDQATRKAHQARIPSSGQQKAQPSKASKSQQPTVSSQKGWFVGWHWTDFIILIMGVNFILILVYQAFINGGDKYKTL